MLKDVTRDDSIDSCINELSISTPFTFQRITENMDGSIIGFSMKSTSSNTPLFLEKNFYLSSQWTGDGGGFYNAIRNSNEIIKKII